ncbi:MAG: flavodoxin domain-containing protein [Verrucomicrobiota bacterium]
MIHLIYASETGNAQSIAEDAEAHFKNQGHRVRLLDMDDLQLKDLETIDVLLAAVSTWGDGDPPSTGEDFFSDLQGSDIPLSHVRFSVYALGDTAYDEFCQFGKDLDAELSRLGARQMLPVVENDVDFEENFDSWLEDLNPLIGDPQSNSTTESTPSSVVA